MSSGPYFSGWAGSSGLFDSEVQPASINAKTEQSTSMPRLRAHAPIEYLHRRPAKLAVFMESFLL
jgi:hypothetical protein